ncbi:DinB family protein [Rufibacter sp. LB8]|uniref:DinB family protein n=1 Tax=Rufibacter sp. LB8 TaxID=2777781 RepID=UPI00178C4B91|nr:DinB family protein [Rufibacter sp. LB8]
MEKQPLPEVWLRGPVPQVPALLQPVAHALLQAQEEVAALLQEFPDHQLWTKPAGAASVAFHLQHLTGVLHRLAIYARGESLTPQDLENFKTEGLSAEKGETAQALQQAFFRQIEVFIQQLKETKEATLTEPREVGRAKLPSTVMGLLFHAAEHTMRHTGQLLVTVKVLREEL